MLRFFTQNLILLGINSCNVRVLYVTSVCSFKIFHPMLQLSLDFCMCLQFDVDCQPQSLTEMCLDRCSTQSVCDQMH